MIESECRAMELLRELGAHVRKLPESRADSVTTIDFLAKYPQEGLRYLIELKTKDPRRFDDHPITRTLKQGGGNFTVIEPISYRNTVADSTRDAVRQLRATQSKRPRVSLLLLYADGHDPDVQLDQFRTTLYGIVDLRDCESGITRPCFYFTESEFFRARYSLDGAIIASDTKAKAMLCLNDYSPRYETLRSSCLAQNFKQGLCDPKRLHEAEKVFIADDVGDRSNQETMLRLVQKKYDRINKLSPIAVIHSSFGVLWPRNS